MRWITKIPLSQLVSKWPRCMAPFRIQSTNNHDDYYDFGFIQILLFLSQKKLPKILRILCVCIYMCMWVYFLMWRRDLREKRKGVKRDEWIGKKEQRKESITLYLLCGCSSVKLHSNCEPWKHTHTHARTQKFMYIPACAHYEREQRSYFMYLNVWMYECMCK